MRNICGISGGKDSSALAVYMRGKVPDMEYFFCDTGAELPETYKYLAKLEVVLGKKIARLNSKRGFDHYFEIFRGTLPSPQMRWCTSLLKIKPLEDWIGEDEATSYVAIRADESNRKGYISTKPNIRTVFPFVDGAWIMQASYGYLRMPESTCQSTMSGGRDQAATSASSRERPSGSAWQTGTRISSRGR